MTARKAKRKPASRRKRATTAFAVGHGVEYVAPAQGVELPSDFPASMLAAEAQAMLESLFAARHRPEARRLAVLAARLRRAWLDAEARSIERASPRAAHRSGSLPEGIGRAADGGAGVRIAAGEALTMTDRAICALCRLTMRPTWVAVVLAVLCFLR